MRLAARISVATLLFPLATQAQTPSSPSYSIVAPSRTLPSASAPAPATVKPREPVQLADRSLRATTATVPDEPPAPLPEVSGDPYGFAAHFNYYRAVAGLPPVSYDPNLSNWASHNNVAQTRRGLGHFVNPNCFQNCAWNITDAATAAQTWMNSTGHRENMLSPNISRFGIAYGPGPYWTLNAQ